MTNYTINGQKADREDFNLLRDYLNLAAKWSQQPPIPPEAGDITSHDLYKLLDKDGNGCINGEDHRHGGLPFSNFDRIAQILNKHGICAKPISANPAPPSDERPIYADSKAGITWFRSRYPENDEGDIELLRSIAYAERGKDGLLWPKYLVETVGWLKKHSLTGKPDSDELGDYIESRKTAVLSNERLLSRLSTEDLFYLLNRAGYFYKRELGELIRKMTIDRFLKENPEIDKVFRRSLETLNGAEMIVISKREGEGIYESLFVTIAIITKGGRRIVLNDSRDQSGRPCWKLVDGDNNEIWIPNDMIVESIREGIENGSFTDQITIDDNEKLRRHLEEQVIVTMYCRYASDCRLSL